MRKDNGGYANTITAATTKATIIPAIYLGFRPRLIRRTNRLANVPIMEVIETVITKHMIIRPVDRNKMIFFRYNDNVMESNNKKLRKKPSVLGLPMVENARPNPIYEPDTYLKIVFPEMNCQIPTQETRPPTKSKFPNQPTIRCKE